MAQKLKAREVASDAMLLTMETRFDFKYPPDFELAERH